MERDANQLAADDLRTLDRFHGGERWLDKEADLAWGRVAGLVGTLQQEVESQMGSKLDAQTTLKAITDALCLDFSSLGNGWREAAPKILARIEEIVDETERGFRERDEAERARKAERVGRKVAEADSAAWQRAAKAHAYDIERLRAERGAAEAALAEVRGKWQRDVSAWAVERGRLTRALATTRQALTEIAQTVENSNRHDSELDYVGGIARRALAAAGGDQGGASG